MRVGLNDDCGPRFAFVVAALVEDDTCGHLFALDDLAAAEVDVSRVRFRVVCDVQHGFLPSQQSLAYSLYFGFGRYGRK